MVLDQSILLQSCGGDEEFARELFGEYQQRVRELIGLMRLSLASHQMDELRKLAHELKGSSITLGAVEMAGISRNIEDGIKGGQAVSCQPWIDDLEQQSLLLFAHLQTLGYLPA